MHKRDTQSGFTIVELLIVVVVIAVLAAITIVSYNGIIANSRQTATEAETQSLGKVIETDKVTRGSYALNMSEVPSLAALTSSDKTYSYHSDGESYCMTLYADSWSLSYYISNVSPQPQAGECPQDAGVTVTTLAGSGTLSFANGTGAAAGLAGPAGIISHPSGLLYFTDGAGSRIRSVSTTGVVATVAGNGGSSYAEGTGNTALFHWPQAIATDGTNLFVADSNNHRIRQVTTAGVSSFIAGSTAGYTEGTGAGARFSTPRGITYDAATSRIYVADSQSNRIRYTTAAGTTSLLAGASGGFLDGTGSGARFNYPQGIAMAPSGDLIVADTLNHRIRRVTPAGVVTTIAGGASGFQDGASGTAQFSNPMAVTVASSGVIYVADAGNNRIRMIATDGEVSTVAGDGTAGFLDAVGTEAQFSSPRGIAIGSDGRLYVADTNNHRIRVLAI